MDTVLDKWRLMCLWKNLCIVIQYMVEKCSSGVEVIAMDEDAQGELEEKAEDRTPVNII